jgi:exopolysaccharide biosynthesis polyprenyl glycosylphosphotransferase
MSEVAKPERGRAVRAAIGDPPPARDDARPVPDDAARNGLVLPADAETPAAPRPETVDAAGHGAKANRLRRFLVIGDVVALTIGWACGLWLADDGFREDPLQPWLLLVASVGLGLWMLSVQGLYLARVSAIRSVEMSKLFRAAVLTAAGELLLARVARVPIRVREVIVAALVSFVLLVVFRSIFRAYMAENRKRGRYIRPLVLVGASPEAAEIVKLLETHPEAGYHVVGVVGDRASAFASGLAGLWRGSGSELVDVMDDLDVNGALLVTSALSASELNAAARMLQERGDHVHLSNGLQGIDFRRLRALPLAYEPMFYLEAAELSPAQVALKRVIDVGGSAFGLVLLAPVFLLIWIAVKIDDRGPLLFSQVRVGRNGREFNCLKFRTMVPDAEAKQKELELANQRSGPLFKMKDDPRITRVGRLLRESSLDELPQLINVLRGEMSLVGPRPALPKEIEKFDEDLRERVKVRPGLTGLWQVEARDNPSFDAYRRLDLYYVDNWSLSLDFVILLATAEHVVTRLLSAVIGRRRGEDTAQPLS